MAKKSVPAVKLTQDFLATVTALLNTPPMPKGKRKASKPARKGKKR